MEIVSFILGLCHDILPFAVGYLAFCVAVFILPIKAILGQRWNYFANTRIYHILEWTFFLSVIVVALEVYSRFALSW